MARGRGNQQRGGGGGDNGDNTSGRGRGRGGGRGSHRGQLTPRGGRVTPNRGRGGPVVYTKMDVIDVDIQRFTDVPDVSAFPVYGTPPRTPNRGGGGGRGTPNYRGGRGRGRGRGWGGGTPKGSHSGTNTPNLTNVTNVPRPPASSLGYGAPSDSHFRRDEPSGKRRVSRGIGATASYSSNVPLSQLLDRPLLRPVVFVRAQLQPVLFERTEDILEGVHVEEEPEDHVPTADRVSEIFSPKQKARDTFFYSADDDVFASINELEPVLTVDFDSLGTAMQKLEKTHLSTGVKKVRVESGGNEGVTKSVETLEVVESTDVVVTSATNGVEHASKSQEAAMPPTPSSDLTSTMPASQSATSRNIRSDPAIVFAGPILPSDDTYIPGHIVDVTPTPLDVQDVGPPILTNRVSEDTILGQSQDMVEEADDEVIVYDAPFPLSATDVSETEHSTSSRTRQRTSNPPQNQDQTNSTPKTATVAAPSFTSATSSISFTSVAVASERNRQQYSLYASPRGTPRRITKLDRHTMRARVDKNRQALFNGRSRTGGFGGTLGTIAAMLEEKHLHEDELEKPDPKKRERRIGDSDLDWGETSESAMEQLSSDLGGMDIDPDVDTGAYDAFVKRMAGVQAGEHVTMDDLADIERIRKEDERDEKAWRRTHGEGDDDDSESADESVDEEIEAVLKIGEETLIAEPADGLGSRTGSDDDSEDDGFDESDDEDETPRRGFKKRLEMVRARSASEAAKGAKSGKGRRVEDGVDDDDEAFEGNLTWAEKDDDYLGMIQDLLDEDTVEDIDEDMAAKRKGRMDKGKGKAGAFKAVRDGDFDEFVGLEPARRRKDLPTHLPAPLQAQWATDRAKKAEHKRQRQRDRIAAATDMLTQHRGGKKGHKAIVAGARAAREYEAANRRDDSDSDSDLANALRYRVVDPESLVDQIKRFLADPGAGDRLSLPPMTKPDRECVHKLADVVGLKSKSVGNGNNRYTTLIKKQTVGRKNGGNGYAAWWDAGVEKKVVRIVRKWGSFEGSRGGGKGARGGASMPKHREGDEVGKAAPKINEMNVGFKMLSAMGWSDGDRIGLSGGLDAPLTAIIKNTKRGLGATGKFEDFKR